MILKTTTLVFPWVSAEVIRPAFLAVLLTAVLACGSSRAPDWAHEATSIRISVKSGAMGTPDSPLEIGPVGGPYVVSLDVLSAAEGKVLDSFSGWLRMSSRPGRITLASTETTVVGNDVLVVDGHAGGIEVGLLGVFGKVFLWAEDIGYVPHPAGSVAACDDGLDNDGDGMIDADGDPGCFDWTDDSEASPSLASGTSPPIYYRNPILAEVQGRGKESPYQGEVVTTDSGDMVVTRVSRDGMYVTDYSDAGGHNHMFVYNFNTPAGVRVCDRLFSLSGTVGEFYGFTELNFPSWDLNPWYEVKGACPLPEPTVITASELSSNDVMEAWESALVRVRDVTVSDFTVDCDHNGDGEVDFEDFDTGACSTECECRDACEQDAYCTELNQYLEYGQWAVSVGGQKLWVVTRETIPGFDPFAPGHAKELVSITGTLRNLRFLRPAWILEPRCPQDLIAAGDPPPIVDTCIFPRTGEEDEPN